MYYSHSYEDPDGYIVDVMVDDDEDVYEYRNARVVRDHRSQGSSPSSSQDGRRYTRPPRHPSSDGAPSPRSAGGSMVPRARHDIPQARPHQGGPARPAWARPYPQSGPFVPMGPLGFEQAGYFAIKKDALAEIIPSLGQVWASFLGRPELPKAVGNDTIDRDNAALHRDALAHHQQNQTRILALTDLAARAVKLFAS